MAVDWKLVTDITVPLACVVAGALLTRWLERKPKVITFFGSISTHLVAQTDETRVQVHTHDLIVRNVGKRSAKNLRISHFVLPDYHITPRMKHEVEEIRGGNKDIVVELLHPNEQLTISYLYFPPLEGWRGSCRSEA